jgi:hypothetical protein
LTHQWENRVFAFILAITEVNMYLAYKYFVLEDNNNNFDPSISSQASY